MEELEFEDSDLESEEEVARAKVRRLCLMHTSVTDLIAEATQDCCIETSSETQDLPISSTSSRDP